MRNDQFVSNYLINPNLITPINKISDAIPTPVADSLQNPINTFYAINLNYKLPYLEQMNLNVQRQMPFGVVVTVGYVGALGKRQSGSNNAIALNSASPGVAAIQTRRPLYGIYPNLGAVAQVRNYFTTSYDSLQTNITKHYSNGMTFTVNYTWSHAIDNQAYRYYVTDQFTTIRESASSDIRNRVSALWVYRLPTPGLFKTGWGRNIVKDWSLTTAAIAEDGTPFTVTQTGNQINGAGGTSNTPNQVASFRVAHPTAAEWFNPTAFAAQPNYTWGNGGTNGLNAPGNWDVDLGLHRDVKIRERFTMEFRAEAFDFTNTRFPNAPISTLGQAGFGSITTYSNNRTMQLAAKLLF
jgi:hypothetical protein